MNKKRAIVVTFNKLIWIARPEFLHNPISSLCDLTPCDRM